VFRVAGYGFDQPDAGRINGVAPVMVACLVDPSPDVDYD
jgi:hypothetical protein